MEQSYINIPLTVPDEQTTMYAYSVIGFSFIAASIAVYECKKVVVLVVLVAHYKFVNMFTMKYRWHILTLTSNQF